MWDKTRKWKRAREVRCCQSRRLGPFVVIGGDGGYKRRGREEQKSGC